MEQETDLGLLLFAMDRHLISFSVSLMFFYFCNSCKVPCEEVKKHIDEVHKDNSDSIQMEFDHVLPLCGPGHVEKNLLGATITVLWDLIG